MSGVSRVMIVPSRRSGTKEAGARDTDKHEIDAHGGAAQDTIRCDLSTMCHRVSSLVIALRFSPSFAYRWMPIIATAVQRRNQRADHGN